MTTAPLTAPARWYADPAFWEIERKAIFGAAWQFVAHESDLPAPRAWRADVLAGAPVILVRGDDGVVRGFHNVCRHRAGPLVREESGVCDGALTCQYHGWRYALDGRLRAARDFGAAADFDVRDYGLFPISLQTWRGLIFASLSPKAPEFASLMAPVDTRLGHADWSELKVSTRRTHLLECNWKTYVENYLEGYHVPAMHPSLDAEIQADKYSVVVEGQVAIHAAPPKRSDTVYNGLWAWIWPNLGFNVYQSGLMIERMSPVGHAQTRLDYLYLTPDGQPVSADTMQMSDQVTAEDKWITERVQVNLNAGVYDRGRLSPKHEGGVAAFQQWVRDAIGAE